ncbi:MAG TPA: S41 family peptidase [Holophagaceae bacterium]|nr:S41 family peptidase [Holophagaceae bacterium]
MVRRVPLLLAFLGLGLPARPLLAQGPAPAAGVALPTVLSPAEREGILKALAEALRERYVFPEVAERVCAGLAAKAKAGAYAGAADPATLGKWLTADLRALGADRHFEVRVEPDFKPQTLAEEDAPPTPQEVIETRQGAAARGFGVSRVERLPGNVGVLEVRGFWPVDLAAPALDAAFALLAGSRGLILDLRRNRGGRPEAVSYLLSHCFAEGDARHLNDIFDRPRNRTRQFWTSPVPGPRFTGPIIVLTSAATFSGGEECAYDLQQQKRATIMGEVTGGGANPGGLAALGQGLVAFIPSGRSINPISKTNWEHVGVKPDMAVPAAEALKAAQVALLERFVGEEQDPEERQALAAVLAKVRKGEAEGPR